MTAFLFTLALIIAFALGAAAAIVWLGVPGA